jgi:adenylosuccinate lyase
MSFILVDEMLRLVTRVLDGLEVSPENMERNLELSQGSLLAERIVNLLVETGVPRQDAHERIRKLSIKSLDSKIPFGQLLLEDTFVSKRLKPKEIKEALDYRTYLGVTRELINLALKE